MTLLARVEAQLFAPSSARALGGFRFLSVGGLFLLYALYAPLSGHPDVADRRAWADLPAILYEPLWAFRWLGVGVPSSSWVAPLWWVWLLSLFTGAVGLWTRLSLVTAAAAGFVLVQLPHNFGQVTHTDAHVVLLLAVLACARCGDGLSVDAALRARKGAPEPAPSGDYTWPVWGARLVLVCVLFLAGLAKLRHAGLSHLTTDMTQRLLVNTLRYFPGVMTGPGAFIASSDGWSRLVMGGVIVVELVYPLALVSRRARPFVALSGVVMLVLIDRFFALRFAQLILAHVAWLPFVERSKGDEGEQPPAARS